MAGSLMPMQGALGYGEMANSAQNYSEVLTHGTYLSHPVQHASHGGGCCRDLAPRQGRSNCAREMMVFQPDEKARLFCASEPRLLDPRIGGAHVRIDQRSPLSRGCIRGSRASSLDWHVANLAKSVSGCESRRCSRSAERLPSY